MKSTMKLTLGLLTGAAIGLVGCAPAPAPGQQGDAYAPASGGQAMPTPASVYSAVSTTGQTATCAGDDTYGTYVDDGTSSGQRVRTTWRIDGETGHQVLAEEVDLEGKQPLFELTKGFDSPTPIVFAWLDSAHMTVLPAQQGDQQTASFRAIILHGCDSIRELAGLKNLAIGESLVLPPGQGIVSSIEVSPPPPTPESPAALRVDRIIQSALTGN